MHCKMFIEGSYMSYMRDIKYQIELNAQQREQHKQTIFGTNGTP